MGMFAKQLILYSVLASILVICGVRFNTGNSYWIIGCLVVAAIVVLPFFAFYGYLAGFFVATLLLLTVSLLDLLAGCLVLASVLISFGLWGLLTEGERSYIGSVIDGWLEGVPFPPYELKTIDDYIKRERNKMLLIRLGALVIIIALCIYLFYPSPRFMIFVLILLLGIYSLYQLLTFKKRLGERVLEVACPECENYMLLFRWKCPGCDEVLLDRHMIEGCVKCGTKYGSGERDIHATGCGICGSELSFFSPYDFKNWSVLANGDSPINEVTLVERFRFIKLLAAGCFLWATFNLLFGAYTLVSVGKYMEKNYHAALWAVGLGVAFLLIEGWLLPMFLRLIKYPPMRTKINTKKKEEHVYET